AAGDPAGGRRPALREAEDGHRQLTVAAEPRENGLVDGIEVRDVVGDLRLAVFARHPARADLRVPVQARLPVAVVEARERLGRDDETRAIVDRVKALEERGGKLGVAVEHVPDLAHPGPFRAEHREPRRALDLDRNGANVEVVGHAAAVSRTLQISPLWALITPARST